MEILNITTHDQRRRAYRNFNPALEGMIALCQTSQTSWGGMDCSRALLRPEVPVWDTVGNVRATPGMVIGKFTGK